MKRRRSKGWKGALAIAVFGALSIVIALFVPRSVAWVFVGLSVVAFFFVFDYLGSISTGFFKDGDWDPPKEKKRD